MDWILEKVLGKLLSFRYLAMFGILFFCGLGLPLPEEVTLVGSGLLVGWGEAEFTIASLACILGILAGDTVIFGLGHHYGKKFLQSRPMRFLLTSRRQIKVAKFFAKHGTKAVFFARFFVGVRIGVYAYAGSQKMSWFRFIFLDLLGALISGPTSVFIGMIVAENLPGEDLLDVYRQALEAAGKFGHWILLAILIAIAAVVARNVLRRRRKKARSKMGGLPPAAPKPSGSQEAGIAGPVPVQGEAADATRSASTE